MFGDDAGEVGVLGPGEPLPSAAREAGDRIEARTDSTIALVLLVLSPSHFEKHLTAFSHSTSKSL